jgi:chromosome segregation ATPase
MSVEQRLTRVEEAIEVMKTLLVSRDERLEDYYKALAESRRDFEFKINALIDSQIKTDVELREMRRSIVEVKESIVELKKTSESTLKRLERLENKNGTN